MELCIFMLVEYVMNLARDVTVWNEYFNRVVFTLLPFTPRFILLLKFHTKLPEIPKITFVYSQNSSSHIQFLFTRFFVNFCGKNSIESSKIYNMSTVILANKVSNDRRTNRSLLFFFLRSHPFFLSLRFASLWQTTCDKRKQFSYGNYVIAKRVSISNENIRMTFEWHIVWKNLWIKWIIFVWMYIFKFYMRFIFRFIGC